MRCNTSPTLECASDIWHRLTMQLIDSHCHLADARLTTHLSDVIGRSRKTGVDEWIVPSTGSREWQRLSGLVQQFGSLHAAFGIHPWYCDAHTEADFAQLRGYLSGAVALGECGLDFGPNRPDEASQLNWLNRQLELAEKMSLPVILHAHKALDRLMHELKFFPGLRGVVHGFAGSRQQADQLVDMGYHLGIGMRIMRPEANRLRELVRELPLERICIETDAPDQAIPGTPGGLNEPAALIGVLDALAEIRKLPARQLAERCNANARELFGL